MSETVDLQILSIQINPEKVAKFQQWCQEKQLDINQVLCQFIDSCLEQNSRLIDGVIKSDNDYLSYYEVEIMIRQALQPLLSRINILEKQLQNHPSQISDTFTQNQDDFAQEKAKSSEITLLVNNVFQEEERTYLPRHQIWQMLKQTDYIKSCGYDSFLAATPDEFIDYGIFFDREKKRYYIKS